MPVGGQPGNKNAAKAKIWSDALRKHAVNNPECIPDTAKKLWEMAIGGDLGAIKEVGDRLEGKVANVIAGDPNQPLTVELITEYLIKDAPEGDK